ncbi:hypothetical protein [Burkholderia pyrrocinia]|uniref:hypothetical protein n=1 Tax=Burkholderia pyrrocinia TaxID=60550 RepID=UPI00158D6D58|nr:hypothetical protein [Burkholderia pyrrocinia]
MAMKFGRAWCDEVGDALTPYRARELYTDEESEYYGRELTFHCEDKDCRVLLTPVGIYMTRKSKRALHYRTKDEHADDCDFRQPGSSGTKVRSPSDSEDDYKPTDFPTEFVLNPPKRKKNGEGTKGGDGEGGDGGANGGTGGGGHGGNGGRKTSTKTRYLDEVVDCFLSGDETGKARQFTIDGKTKAFSRFFKKIQYFGDETGLIYYGALAELKVYNGNGVGLRFVDPVWVERKPYRVWVYVPQERIDASRRRKAFLAEMVELEKAIADGEEVLAFFVGAYLERTTVERPGGKNFDVFRAELASVDHLSLTFAKS